MQGIDDRQEREAPKTRVAGTDAADAVLAHQDGRVQVVAEIAANIRMFHSSLRQHRRVTPRRSQHLEP